MVIGGGIIGCSAAAIMADRGARVVVVERTAIGAGASGRNLGAIQHPFDPVLAGLYVESLARYQALAGITSTDFSIDPTPAGLLLLDGSPEAAAAQADRIGAAFPELEPELLSADEVQRLEPLLAHGPSGIRLATGYPVPPAAATAAWATLADERGAAFVVGSEARPRIEGERVVGVELGNGEAVDAPAVLVAAGPWTPALVDPSGAWQPIRSTWGVTLQLRLDGAAPRHIIEEDEVDGVNRAAAATARAAEAEAAAEEPPSLFTLASAGGISTLGSTFLATEPDPTVIEPILLRRAMAFLPSIREATLVGSRVCARPQSVDGRPFIGAVPMADGLYVCAGHGPWGISTGPASAAMAARAVLDETRPPPELAASRTVT